MKVGASIWLDRPARDCAQIAVVAEEAGFHTLWVPDHYFLRDSFVALALAAEATSEIRLGTSVVSPLLRHPTLLASSFATLHELSGGRAVVGIGTGGAEFPTQLRLPITKPLAMVRETVEIIRALMQGRVDVSGHHFGAIGASLGWRPGPAPIYLAARGPRMLELSGGIADGLITHGLAQSHLAFARSRLEAGAEKVGRSRDACELGLMFDYEHDDDPLVALDRLRERCMFMVAGSYAEELIPIYGLDPEEVVPIREAVTAGEYERAVSLITNEMVEAFNVGGPEGVLADRLAYLESQGVSFVILSLGGGSVEDAVARMRRAGKVVARFA